MQIQIWCRRSFYSCLTAFGFLQLLLNPTPVELAMARPTWSNLPPVEPCGGNFPSTFICPLNTTCIQLTANYSATMCCPAGESCDTVALISCDTTQWNTTTSIKSDYHSIDPVSLAKCGDSCCPVGYNCNGTTCLKTPLEKAVATSSIETQQTTTHRQTATRTSTLLTATYQSATSLPNNTATSDSQPQKSDGLNMTTKALIGVLAALLLVIMVAFLWRCIYRREHQQPRPRRNVESTASHYACQYSKSELDGMGRRTATPLAEMNGYRTPGELSVGGSRYGAPSLKELQAAYFQTPRSINSERREMDAWSLQGYKGIWD